MHGLDYACSDIFTFATVKKGNGRVSCLDENLSVGFRCMFQLSYKYHLYWALLVHFCFDDHDLISRSILHKKVKLQDSLSLSLSLSPHPPPSPSGEVQADKFKQCQIVDSRQENVSLFNYAHRPIAACETSFYCLFVSFPPRTYHCFHCHCTKTVCPLPWRRHMCRKCAHCFVLYDYTCVLI